MSKSHQELVTTATLLASIDGNVAAIAKGTVGGALARLPFAKRAEKREAGGTELSDIAQERITILATHKESGTKEVLDRLDALNAREIAVRKDMGLEIPQSLLPDTEKRMDRIKEWNLNNKPQQNNPQQTQGSVKVEGEFVLKDKDGTTLDKQKMETVVNMTREN